MIKANDCHISCLHLSDYDAVVPMCREGWPADERIGTFAGNHDGCEGQVEFVRIHPSANTLPSVVLYCPRCHLRVQIPGTITTYGELADYLAQRQETGSDRFSLREGQHAVSLEAG